VGVDRLGAMPVPERIQFSKASVHDLTALRQYVAYLPQGCLVGDKAYWSASLNDHLLAQQQLDLLTPVKLKKGQKRLDSADKLFSAYVSRMRQPLNRFQLVN